MTGLLGLVTGSSLIPALIGGLALVGASAAATHSLDSRIYGDQIKGLKLQSANAVAAGYKQALDQFIADSSQIHDAAARFQVQQVNLQAQFSAIKEAFADATKFKALPASCVPDSERLRVLAAAISAANSAAAAGPNTGKPLSKPIHPSNR